MPRPVNRFRLGATRRARRYGGGRSRRGAAPGRVPTPGPVARSNAPWGRRQSPQPWPLTIRRQHDPDPGPLVFPGDRAMGLVVLVAAAAWLSPSVLAAQTGGSTHTRPITISRAVRTDGILRIDGRLDEKDWAGAAVTDSFIQIDPAEGKP